jgi:hypothetical protein
MIPRYTTSGAADVLRRSRDPPDAICAIDPHHAFPIDPTRGSLPHCAAQTFVVTFRRLRSFRG